MALLAVAAPGASASAQGAKTGGGAASAPQRSAPVPGYRLGAPPAVTAGRPFTVDLGAEGRAGDRLTLAWLEGPEGQIATGAPAEAAFPPTEEVEGRWQVRLDAPDDPGTYELRLEEERGAVLERREIVVEADAALDAEGADSGASACSAAPDGASLEAAFQRSVDAFLAGARLTYGRRYHDLSYDLRVLSADVSAERGAVEASYEGSAVDGDTGEEVSASGTIDADYRWSGCGWDLVGFTY